MFKKGEKVIYPRYGLTTINKIYKEKVADAYRDYYELGFENNLTVSIPVNEAEILGLRYPMTDKLLLKELDKIDQVYSIPEDLLNTYNDYMRNLLITGLISDAVTIIRFYKALLNQPDQSMKDLNEAKETNSKAIESVKAEINIVFGEHSPVKLNWA